MARLTVFTYDLASALQLARQTLIGNHNLVEGIGNLAGKTGLIARQADRKIAVAYRLQSPQELPYIQLVRINVDIATVRTTIGLRTTGFAGLSSTAAHTLLCLHHRAPKMNSTTRPGGARENA